MVFDWDYAIPTAFPQKLVGFSCPLCHGSTVPQQSLLRAEKGVQFICYYPYRLRYDHSICCASFLSFFLFALTLIGSQTYRHRSACVPFVLAAIVLYAIDHLVRIVRTRHTTGWLTAEHALNRGTTLVLVPSLRAGWRAGQHVRVRIASDGWLVWLATWFLGRARPFTIAAGPDSGGMTLQIKALGSWSRNLLRMAEDADDIPLKGMSASAERGRGSAREVRVIVEGPYGNYY